MMRERLQDMNEYEPVHYASQLAGHAAGRGMSPFVLGALAGAAVALLLAPQPGSDSRHWLADRARKLRGHGDDHDTGYDGGERESGSSTNRGGMKSAGTGTTPGVSTGSPLGTSNPGSPKSPTSTNPIPTSPTGSARV